jgi:hypothetical protein
MATFDEETAESMAYLLPGRTENGKPIEGPSVRLAEVAGSCWGNVRYGARVIETGEEYLTARGYCYDLERNVAIEIDVRRSIVGKKGRYSANMIQTVGQAACAIALRNAIFKVIPMAFIKPALEAAKKVAAGDIKSLGVRRDTALAWFKEKGIKPEQVFGFLGIAGKDDVTLTHLQQMSAIRTSIKDGEATLEDFFKNATTNITPDSLDAFTKPASVTAEDDPKKEHTRSDQSMPVVEAQLAEEPKKEEKPIKATTKKPRTSEDEDLDKLFSKE